MSVVGAPRRVLVLSTFTGTSANVIGDYLFAFNAYSRHRYYYVFDCRILDRDHDFSRYDVILIFWSLYLLGPDLADEVRERIRRAPALKVLFLQDEYRDVRRMNAVMRDLGIEVMCTCVAEEDHERFYPKALIPSLEATYTVLTGYVPSYLDRIPLDLQTRRPLDIAYRSRAVPYWLGDLGQEKRIVAERFQVIAWERGLRSDISVREEDRIYGRRWVRFLRSARFVLGTASGASVVDLTGEIRANCQRHVAEDPEATYAELKRRFFADVDWTLVIDTVSPRIFEAAALGCTLVLHEGRYGDILRPGEHYIQVRRDYSNADDVVRMMSDPALARALAARAHRDLIASGAYSYRTFVARFDEILARHRPGVVARGRLSRAAFYGRSYLRQPQAIVPVGASFFTIPPRTLVTKLATKLEHVPGNVALSDVPVTKALLALRWTAVDGRLRRLFLRYLRHRVARGDVGTATVLRDCARLAIARMARTGRLADPERQRPFDLVPTLDLGGSRLVLKSNLLRENGDHEALDGGADAATVEALLRSRTIRTVVWDHSAVGMTVAAPVGLKRRIPFVFEDGLYIFASLPILLRHLPDETVSALELVISGVDSGRHGAAPDGELRTRDVDAGGAAHGSRDRARWWR